MASDFARLMPSLSLRSARRGDVASIHPERVRLDRVFREEIFRNLLVLERRRAQRSRKPFVLMLLQTANEKGSMENLRNEVLDCLGCSVRETDLIGWYTENSICGIIFTEVSLSGEVPITETLKAKIFASLEMYLGKDKISDIAISAHLFPDDSDREPPDPIADSKLYPDIERLGLRKRVALAVKRAIDVVASAGILLLMSPVLALIALLIKVTSEGPVLFRQERLGMRGARFNCLKFRTMYNDCDSRIHQEYVHQFIIGKTQPDEKGSPTSGLYKIKEDHRVTPIGRFLRKASLDEFPQLWNVLRGEMSLVGPRPPLLYEFKAYDVWHRRRVLEVKPGVTGLWQVSGRSRMRFEEMVRLDLQYAQSWSLWLDVKILAATPLAVCSGEGAY